MNDMARCGAALVVLVTIGGANALAEPQAFPSAGGGGAGPARRAGGRGRRGLLRAIFGPEYADDLIGSDIAILREEMRETREAMRAATALLPEADGRVILTIGRQAFPFPVPIVREGEAGTSTVRRAWRRFSTGGSARTSSPRSRPCGPTCRPRSSMRAPTATATRSWSTRSA